MAKILADLELLLLDWKFPTMKDIVDASKDILLLQVDVWNKTYDRRDPKP